VLSRTSFCNAGTFEISNETKMVAPSTASISLVSCGSDGKKSRILRVPLNAPERLDFRFAMATPIRAKR
jgi:hypothetical protein